jgi:hypothetical protein
MTSFLSSMLSAISWSDISLVGIGLDIAGAVLLAKGLLMTDKQVIGVTRTIFGYNPDHVVSRVEDRIAATVGVLSILVGVAAQLVGYAASLSVGPDNGATPSRGQFGLLLAAAAIAIIWLLYLAIRPMWRRRLLVRIARYDNDLHIQPRPFGPVLEALGRAAGMSARVNGESETDYARRVWRVREVTENWPRGS